MKWPDRYQKDTAGEKFDFKYMEHAIAATRKKSFFITSKGYMGLGPPQVDKGDLVCVIFGCPHPLLMRKEKDHYLLVGEVYVYGMMRGEMIAELETGRPGTEFLIM